MTKHRGDVDVVQAQAGQASTRHASCVCVQTTPRFAAVCGPGLACDTPSKFAGLAAFFLCPCLVNKNSQRARRVKRTPSTKQTWPGNPWQCNAHGQKRPWCFKVQALQRPCYVTVVSCLKVKAAWREKEGGAFRCDTPSPKVDATSCQRFPPCTTHIKEGQESRQAQERVTAPAMPASIGRKSPPQSFWASPRRHQIKRPASRTTHAQLPFFFIFLEVYVSMGQDFRKQNEREELLCVAHYDCFFKTLVFFCLVRPHAFSFFSFYRLV